MEACKKHLDSKQILEGGEEKPFYTEVRPESLENTKSKIKLILQEAFDNKIISKEESDAMNPDATNAGQFYLNFKVHKPQTNWTCNSEPEWVSDL